MRPDRGERESELAKSGAEIFRVLREGLLGMV